MFLLFLAIFQAEFNVMDEIWWHIIQVQDQIQNHSDEQATTWTDFVAQSFLRNTIQFDSHESWFQSLSEMKKMLNDCHIHRVVSLKILPQISP